MKIRLHKKGIILLPLMALLLVGCSSDTDFKRQVNDDFDVYLNTPELKPLIIPEGISLPQQSNSYTIYQAHVQGAVGTDLDIRPPVVPKSIIGTRTSYSDKTFYLSSLNNSDWEKVQAAVRSLNIPVLTDSDSKIITGPVEFDKNDKEARTVGEFEITHQTGTILFQLNSLQRQQKALTSIEDDQRYLLRFFNQIMTQIESMQSKAAPI